jgi:dihydrolipoamide dehydrogenase
MAQAFQTLGSQVTLIEGERRVLPREEPFACAQAGAALERYGVDVRIGRRAVRFGQRDGVVTVTTDDGATVAGDRLLVSLGRRAPTADLGIETVGLEVGEAVRVDARMRVAGRPWLYAVGDINVRALHTHMGKYQARVAADCILGKERGVHPLADGALAPRVIFTDPQIAAVGHTTETAARTGLAVDAYRTETSGNLGGLFYGTGAPGTAQFLVDRARRVLVGCTITGSEVADFLHAATIAVTAGVTLERLRDAVPPFPTRSEIWLSLLEQAGV